MPNSRFALHGKRPLPNSRFCAPFLPLIHGLCAFFRLLLTPLSTSRFARLRKDIRDRKKGSLRKGLEESLKSLDSLQSLESGRTLFRFPQSGGLESLRFSRFSRISRKWTFLKRPLFQKTPFSEPEVRSFLAFFVQVLAEKDSRHVMDHPWIASCFSP